MIGRAILHSADGLEGMKPIDFGQGANHPPWEIVTPLRQRIHALREGADPRADAIMPTRRYELVRFDAFNFTAHYEEAV